VTYEVQQLGFADPQWEVVDDDGDFVAKFARESDAKLFAAIKTALDEHL